MNSPPLLLINPLWVDSIHLVFSVWATGKSRRRWIYWRSKNGQKGGWVLWSEQVGGSCGALPSTASLLSAQTSPHDNHMEESLRWSSHASDRNKQQQQKQQQGVISAPSLLLLTLSCLFLRIHTAARSVRRCFLSCARGFSPLCLCSL